MSDTATGSHAFLGEEFLTWLWWRIERDGGEFGLSRDRILGVALDDLLSFAPRHEDDTRQTLSKGLPVRTEAARTALRNGCRLARARLVLAMDQRVWQVTVVGATMALTSIKLPEDDEETGSDEERSHERIANLLELQELVRELYALFLTERLAPDYLSGPAAEQATWMSE